MADELQVLVAVSLGFILFIVYLYLLFFKRKVDDIDNTKSSEVSETRFKEEISKETFNVSKKKVGTKKKAQISSNKDNGANHSFLIASLKGHTGSIVSLEFSTNGKLLASCSEGRFLTSSGHWQKTRRCTYGTKTRQMAVNMHGQGSYTDMRENFFSVGGAGEKNLLFYSYAGDAGETVREKHKII